MKILTAILGTFLVAAIAFIFWLMKVLKNTLNITDYALAALEGKEKQRFNVKTAYDGKYYPANVITQIIYGAKESMTITDWSKYNSHKLIAFFIYTPETIEQYFSGVIEDFSDDMREVLEQPSLHKNVEVYAPREGVWLWRRR